MQPPGHKASPTSPAPPAPPQGCTCARLRRLTRRVTAVYDHELAAAGLRVSQFSLLAVLRGQAGEQGMPVSNLAAHLDMDRSTLTRSLRPLIVQGWAALQTDASDARVRRALITDAGQAALAAARPHWRRAQDQINGTLGETTVAALHQWLDAVTPAFRPDGVDA
jgi:DNA-binding MarR family transcriptional regulator